MRARKIPAVALVAVAAGLSLTACGGGGSDDASATTPPAAPSAPAAQDTGAPADPASDGSNASGSSSQGSQGSEGSGGSDGSGGSKGSTSGHGSGARCTTANLGLSASYGMAEGEILVNFQNNGPATCTLHGFPGVDLSGKDGTISAARSSLTAPDVTLRHGESTRATVHFPPNTSGGSGATFTTLVVTPPDETHSRSLSVTVNLPVTDGSGSGVSVDPVGTGK
ncbi:DUF4232 domain-containing protein [Actinacidiphila epipremni]|uniref:DUF4232 domain-containing protein n=1 Tax=Actinacidiphila epipremni TaxID=2053013 RepID=A0ABX0ZVS6_9ACTN|nr:DUF4232 domain-containing protein [Actinacidiphila epipremni]NJP47301.1 DUF4232 domain-containing protein [Actinacidiphila epipremni]